MVEKIYWAETKVKLFSPQSKEKSTLVAIAHYADPDGNGAFVSQGRLAFETGHDRRTVRRHIKALVMRGELVTWVDRSKYPRSDRFYIPIVSRLLEDLMRERQLAGLPLFGELTRDKLSLGVGQTDPDPGTKRPTTNQLPSQNEQKKGVFNLKTKKESSLENAKMLELLSEPGPDLAPETQQIIQEMLKQLEMGATKALEEIDAPRGFKDAFLPPLTEQTWQKQEGER